MPQIQEYLPWHLSLLTASLTATTVPTQAPLFVNLSVTIARGTGQTKSRAASRFLIAEIVGEKNKLMCNLPEQVSCIYCRVFDLL